MLDLFVDGCTGNKANKVIPKGSESTPIDVCNELMAHITFNSCYLAEINFHGWVGVDGRLSVLLVRESNNKAYLSHAKLN